MVVRKKRGTALLTVLVCLWAFLLPAAAAQEQTDAEPESAQTVVEALMADYAARGLRLNEDNFALWYYNPVSGEEYSYNPDAMMVAASTYKMPLNLYYYDLEAKGEITADTIIPECNYRLADCHRESLVHSNNEISEAMLHRIGTFTEYKNAMMQYFTTPMDELPYTYYVGNYYSVRMMGDALRHLYEHQEDYPQMLSYMRQGMPNGYFRGKLQGLDIAHKYGSFEGAENDAGIIWADQPFILVVYTWRVGIVEPYDPGEEASEQAKAYYQQKKQEYDTLIGQLESGYSWSNGVTIVQDAAWRMAGYVNRSAKNTFAKTALLQLSEANLSRKQSQREASVLRRGREAAGMTAALHTDAVCQRLSAIRQEQQRQAGRDAAGSSVLEQVVQQERQRMQGLCRKLEAVQTGVRMQGAALRHQRTQRIFGTLNWLIALGAATGILRLIRRRRRRKSGCKV